MEDLYVALIVVAVFLCLCTMICCLGCHVGECGCFDCLEDVGGGCCDCACDECDCCPVRYG